LLWLIIYWSLYNKIERIEMINYNSYADFSKSLTGGLYSLKRRFTVLKSQTITNNSYLREISYNFSYELRLKFSIIFKINHCIMYIALLIMTMNTWSNSQIRLVSKKCLRILLTTAMQYKKEGNINSVLSN